MKKIILLILLSSLIFLSCGKKDKDEKVKEDNTYTEIVEDKSKDIENKEEIAVTTDNAITSEQAIEGKDKTIDEIISEVLPDGKGELAILIDDSGTSLDLAKNFASLDMRVSFAIMPYMAKSREVNEYLSNAGYTTLLHLPMEGSDTAVNENTKDLLKTSLTEAEIGDIFTRALDNVGPVRGFNNHMGSVFTSSYDAMDIVLSYAKEKRMFYVDSKTIGSSKGYKIAREKRIPTAQCVHFLDNSKSVVDIEKEIIRAAKIAQKKGRALVIGHFHKNMVEALRNSKERLTNSGVKLVFVDEILE